MLKKNEPLARYTSWRVGGPADTFYRPDNLQDLANFLKTLPQHEPVTWLGLGSNVLIRDGGIAGTTIYTQGRLVSLEMTDDTTVRAEAGVTCAKLAKFCSKNKLANGVFFAGIPGTVGGALAMNAGAFGGVTWPVVTQVEMLNRDGDIIIRQPSEFEVAYRQVKCPVEDEWFVAGHFTFESGDEVKANADIKTLLKKRSNTQPIGELNCGSVFRNPPDDHAARLIEACGLKGQRVGDAWVSEKHANFIINGGAATAADIEKLIAQVQNEVYKHHNVQLVREVHILGDNDGKN